MREKDTEHENRRRERKGQPPREPLYESEDADQVTKLIQVVEYNALASQVELPWDAVIDNNGPASDAEILETFSSL